MANMGSDALLRVMNVLQGGVRTRHIHYLRLNETLFKKCKSGSVAFFKGLAVNAPGCRVVLNGKPGGVKEGNFPIVFPARFLPGQNFPDFGMNRVFTDDISVQRMPGFSFLRALGQGIHDHFCPTKICGSNSCLPR